MHFFLNQTDYQKICIKSSLINHLGLIGVVIIISLLLGGCIQQAYRTHPEFNTQIKTISKPLLVSTEVRIAEVQNVGGEALREDWSESGRAYAQKAILEVFKIKKYQISPLIEIDPQTQRDLDALQPLYRAVKKSIRHHVYGTQPFPEKIRRFEYGLGSLEDILSRFDSNAMVFVYGYHRVSKSSPMTIFQIALLDSAGNLSWFSMKGSKGKFDLRNYESVHQLVQDMLIPLPAKG